MSVSKLLLRLFFIVIVASISLSAGPGIAQTAVPMLINYEGELRSPATGEPVPDGAYTMLFRIYDVEFGGTPLWEEVHSTVYDNAVEVRRGIVSVLVGSGEGDPLDPSLFNGADRWLEIRVEAETLEPRQRLTSVPYAMVAENSRLLDGQEASAFAPAAHTHSGSEVITGTIVEARIDPAVARDSEVITMVLASDGSGSGLDADTVDGLDSTDLMSSSVDYGRSGVASDLYEGTATLTDKYVNSAGPERIEGSSEDATLFLSNEGEGGALNALAPDSDYAIRGYSSRDAGCGVYGLGHGGGGQGVVGYSSDERGTGVMGTTTGAYGMGVKGLANQVSDLANYGGYFEAAGDGGSGAYGRASGVRGAGVQGWASNTGDVRNHGGYFRASGREGRGVAGIAPGENGVGVEGTASNVGEHVNYGGYFEARGDFGRGAACIATGIEGTGVYAEATASDEVTNHGGYFTAAGGTGRGATCIATGSQGAGVYGEATSSDNVVNHGGCFKAAGSAGRGATCIATGHMGIGVYGEGPRAGVFSQGDLLVTGAYIGTIGPHGGAPFPRAAYDSGWQAIGAGDSIELLHELGGDPDDYVVDLRFTDIHEGTRSVHNRGYGGWSETHSVVLTIPENWHQGAWWYDLTDTSIKVRRYDDDVGADEVRVRIWVCN